LAPAYFFKIVASFFSYYAFGAATFLLLGFFSFISLFTGDFYFGIAGLPESLLFGDAFDASTNSFLFFSVEIYY